MLKRNKNGIIKMMKKHGLIRLSISFDVWFHIQGINDPDEAWDKMNKVFGKHNVIQAHQLEN
jgi:hypothetical protein